ncbi:BgTH12-01617 [Blumeria graminis f. sp. triticale]|uniref:BgTH12-01617 n=1 Tax=Blumeria graminis f. sp. triticale TaxID=1689686 RepID=A0A9W4GEZ9_BLUGR|nr:BgTH12-01617 [Blumeria graminis f. sp. triticale]
MFYSLERQAEARTRSAYKTIYKNVRQCLLPCWLGFCFSPTRDAGPYVSKIMVMCG